MKPFPKRLIEVDLPIKRISAHARREKSIRHGHISTMHIWWARRPLAACRAIICATLWPDPADPLCPQTFRDEASKEINEFARKAAVNKELAAHCSPESWEKWQKLANSSGLDATKESHWNVLRFALLDFIADFANWDNSTIREYLDTSRALTQASHEALGGSLGTKPLVVDPFAGGGSIPLEALRVGADAFASDLNPVAVLLNKVLLEYIPKYGQQLADEVRRCGVRIKNEAEKELGEFYPQDPDGATPIAYLWARTILCEGPGCGARVPLITNTVVAERRNLNVVVRIRRDSTGSKTLSTGIVEQPKRSPFPDGTVRRSSVTCPICNYTTPAAHVRRQFLDRNGGSEDDQLIAVVTMKGKDKARTYREPTSNDLAVAGRARHKLEALSVTEGASLVPGEPLPYLRSIFNINLLGIVKWGQLFTPRQALDLTTFARIIRDIPQRSGNKELELATSSCLGIVLDKVADFHTILARWISKGEKIGNTFGRQALGIIWDYAEANPFADISGSWDRCVEYLAQVIEHETTSVFSGTVQECSATAIPLPDNAVAAIITDPPYYDLVPYADLSDFFYVWLKRSIGHLHPGIFKDLLSPKREEIVQLAERNPIYGYKTRENFERLMGLAMRECRRILTPTGIGVVFFAHKGTAAWESQLQAMIDGGWTIVGSWPIDTEREGRLRAMDSAVLASSIQLVCRPRPELDGGAKPADPGDWRDVLAELPKRIHEWMPRLRDENVIGADAIFACLGPALEIFSRYDRVEKANGEQVQLKEYLEYVWAAVSKEALNMIFAGADATGFEEDARLTAMWLWTLSTGADGNGSAGGEDEIEDEEDSGRKPKMSGFVLEYDAARKIAQGLGAHLEQLSSLIEVSGDKARLLPVAERARHLFGREEGAAPTKRKGKPKQLSLLDLVGEGDESEGGWGEKSGSRIGATVLDRIHQSMILFAAGRGEAVKRFLVNDGVGQDQRFWRLAQALSALYPKGTDERRWVEGVLARKKGLGF